MTNETKAALAAALATDAFAGVRAALEAEAKRACAKAVLFPQSHYWRNDGWQAAWREIGCCYLYGADETDSIFWSARCLPASGFTFGCSNNNPQDEFWQVILNGDELNDALRDFALGETR